LRGNDHETDGAENKIFLIQGKANPVATASVLNKDEQDTDLPFRIGSPLSSQTRIRTIKYTICQERFE
jgi:hypothetical protein